MSGSRLTKTLAVITKKLKWPENKSVGYSDENFPHNKYLNPLLTPPPRMPRSPEDFSQPDKLGHWYTHGYSYTSPVADKYELHEGLIIIVCGSIITVWLWCYSPDHKMKDWARREAYLRTHKRELLGLPLIDRDVVDPERVVLPTEEEIGDFPIGI